LLVLPAIFLFAYVVAWRLSSPQDPLPAGAGELSDATSHGAPEDVAGFLGVREVDGGVLRARLVPLQSAPDWQAFDAAALARRLGRGESPRESPRESPSESSWEPWRLELSFDAPQGTAPLRLGTLFVASAGARLAPLAAPPADPARAVDPVRTLLARGARALPPGASIEIVLLGAPPRDVARLEVERAAADGGPLVLELLPGLVRTAELARSLARSDGAGAGAEGSGAGAAAGEAR
jgi:hypothetical protein